MPRYANSPTATSASSRLPENPNPLRRQPSLASPKRRRRLTIKTWDVCRALFLCITSVRTAAIVSAVLEVISVIFVWSSSTPCMSRAHAPVFDTAHLSLKGGLALNGIFLAIVLAVLGFVGFTQNVADTLNVVGNTSTSARGLTTQISGSSVHLHGSGRRARQRADRRLISDPVSAVVGADPAGSRLSSTPRRPLCRSVVRDPIPEATVVLGCRRPGR